MTPIWTRLTLAGTVLVLGALALPQTSFAERGTNPYIDDGSIKESPFKFAFPVSEVRLDYNEHNHPVILHFTATDFEQIVKQFQDAYKSKREISPNIVVAGYVYVTPKEHWSFTLKDTTKPNVLLTIAVAENKAGPGSIITLNARLHNTTHARHRRAWLGYSPAGLKPTSVKLF